MRAGTLGEVFVRVGVWGKFRRVRGADTSKTVRYAGSFANWFTFRRVDAVRVAHRLVIKPAPRTLRD